MLIGSASRKPDLEAVRRIKYVLRSVLALPEDATVTVTQLACLEEDCAPLETVVGLLRPESPQLQYKKSTNQRMNSMLKTWFRSVRWGYSIQIDVLKPHFKEY